uniref:uncharacterized protein LOC120337500 isoform X1 n=1 Tax=Styela clava TaxID=7725 RepID=UPI001939FB2B|nr:uncharacterized protein LOC120337500 isoform X1 [Styela clava]
MKTRTSLSKVPSDDEIANSDTAHSSETKTSYITTQHSKVKKHSHSLSKSRRKSSKEKIFEKISLSNLAEGARNADDCALNLTTNDIDRNKDNIQDLQTNLKKSSEDKKSRNLDLVVRRMLKAKKESGEQSAGISCKANEIKSTTAGINTAVDKETANINLAQSEGNYREVTVGKHKQENQNNVQDKGMIDVQLVTENHLSNTERLVRSNSRSTTEQNHRGSSLLNDSCSSPEFSPSTNPGSDSEGSCLKPFVQTTKKSEDSTLLAEKDNEDKMSHIIKQEPVSAINNRMAMYHRNGPMETHSPPSSYGSHSPTEQRSPSPSSPGSRNQPALPSPPELILNPAISHLTPSSAMLMAGGSVNSFLSTMVPPHSSSLAYSHHSPGQHSPRLHYPDEMRNSGVTAAAMAASGIGLPTLVPAISAIPQNGPPPMFHLVEHDGMPRGQFNEQNDAFSQTRRNENESGGIKVSPNAPTGPNPPRGIVGQKAANESRPGRRGANNVDEKCPYKRPPHTYPALIASAILDSPGNLITLRGIYDYIMNNFLYYKFGHDKSAWQNSIRHNLSLNQCFVKVPRYENAAKSNYWTMTREGFEEFGNENSFKRRRRRGAALAPISAYKNKKYNGNNDASNRNAKPRSGPGGNSPSRNGVHATNTGRTYTGWGPARSRTPEPSIGYTMSHESTKVLKRSASPPSKSANMGGKHPRMVVLKQGEGPTLEGLGRSDHPQRPNSLSSVEEMQGNLNSFSKTLINASDNTTGDARHSPRRKNSPNHHETGATPVNHQAWMMAAAQNGFLPHGLIPNLTSSPPSLISQQDAFSLKSASALDAQAKAAAMRSLASKSSPIMLDDIEIGSQVSLFDGVTSVPTSSFCCRFCDYKYIDDTSAMLENHCQALHQFEITNAKAKAVAAAAVAGHKEREALSKSPNGQEAGMMNLLPGFSPSMLAAAAGYTNAQNILAAAQAAGINLPGSAAYPSLTMSNPVTSTSSYFTDPLMRSLALQMSGNSSSVKEIPDVSQANSVDATHRQQQLAAIQQAAMSNAAGQSQEQLRQLIYQQLLMQNPFISGNPSLAASMQRPMPSARNDMSPLAQFIQYQQKALEMASQNASHDKTSSMDSKDVVSPKRPSSHNSNRQSPVRSRKGSSSSVGSNQPLANETEDAEKQNDIHGWKQCQDCNFTAKGAHGLELHNRKAHGSDRRNSVENENAKSPRPGKENEEIENSPNTTNSKIASLASSELRNTFGTQTDTSDDDRRTCQHCDVTFGDDTMHALHMSCHDRSDPFKCTICGQECHEKYYFNVHLLRGLHQPQNKNKKISREDGDMNLGRRHSKSSERSFCSSGSENERVESEGEKIAVSPAFLSDTITVPRVEVPAHDVKDDVTSHA